MVRPPPRSPLFPYPRLFRSPDVDAVRGGHGLKLNVRIISGNLVRPGGPTVAAVQDHANPNRPDAIVSEGGDLLQTDIGHLRRRPHSVPCQAAIRRVVDRGIITI